MDAVKRFFSRRRRTPSPILQHIQHQVAQDEAIAVDSINQIIEQAGNLRELEATSSRVEHAAAFFLIPPSDTQRFWYRNRKTILAAIALVIVLFIVLCILLAKGLL